jgi:hypothetical protein
MEHEGPVRTRNAAAVDWTPFKVASTGLSLVTPALILAAVASGTVCAEGFALGRGAAVFFDNYRVAWPVLFRTIF